MKILYLKLKNFATIYTAMEKKEIEIDFTKCKNHVVLLVGSNGSGKTSILSTLHPFAYSGNMDVRNASNIIRDNHDGYKEIHIQNDDKIYRIQHFYKNSKRGILVKSFIQRDGLELNPNGNVTSFNDTVKIELSLELDFLRLLRLGSNVTNLIDMKSIERKGFTSDLLSDINIYNELSKKVTEDNRVLRNLIKTVSDKITKLNIIDEDLLKSHLKDLEKQVDDCNQKRGALQQEIGQLEGKISSSFPDGVSIASDKLESLKNEYNDIINQINKETKKINSLCLIIDKPIDQLKDDLVRQKNKADKDIGIYQNELELWTSQLSTIKDELDSLTSKLRLITSDIEYSQILKLHVKLTEDVQKGNKKYKDYRPVYTKENLILILNILHQIDDIAQNIYGFDTRAIKKTVSLLRDNVDISKYVNTEMNTIDREILKITSKFNNDSIKNPIILFKPSKCEFDECPYLFLYDLLFKEKRNDGKSGLVQLETEKEILNTMLNVEKNIEYIFMIIKSNIPIISKGSIEYFKIDQILNHIEHGESIFDEDYITNMISEVEDYEDYIESKNKLKDINIELQSMNKNKDTIDMITSEERRLNSKIIILETTIEKIKQNIFGTEEDIAFLNRSLESIDKYIEIDSMIKRNSDRLIQIQNEIKDIETKLESIQNYLSHITIIKQSISNLDWNITNINNEIFNTRFNLKQFTDLSKERKILNNKFEELNLIKESLSSNKGIPLLFIQLYLKNTKMYVNELLSTIYSDDFQIDDFDVNATEFNIPYIKNGIRINDVGFASQGEKSFLSLALSFALINQSIKDYNILLLDEIDSTLDIRNRAMFLNILEKQMASINAEQIFLITHNNMFDSYPVDIILTSSNRLDTYDNANIIFVNE